MKYIFVMLYFIKYFLVFLVGRIFLLSNEQFAVRAHFYNEEKKSFKIKKHVATYNHTIQNKPKDGLFRN